MCTDIMYIRPNAKETLWVINQSSCGPTGPALGLIRGLILKLINHLVLLSWLVSAMRQSIFLFVLFRSCFFIPCLNFHNSTFDFNV